MVRMTFKLESDDRKESAFETLGKNISGRGKSKHEVTKPAKSFLCFLETSRRPLWMEMSERRVGEGL